MAVLLLGALTLPGCTAPGAPAPIATPTRGATAAVQPATVAAGAPRLLSAEDRAAALVARMSTGQRAGQVLMTAATIDGLHALAPLVRRYHLAGVMVRGRSAAGTHAVRRALAPVRAAAPRGLPLLVATDQEGGTVQVLSGPGFARIPSAVAQGHGSVAAQQSRARAWGRSLAAAGVNLDLGPVADVPCASTLHDNPPIADLDREYGTEPRAAGAHVAAVVRGLRAAGVASAVKHFPGLGCVRQNTDTDTRVTDSLTGAGSRRLAAFAAGIDEAPGFVMVSSARYSRIDPGVPALFSSRVIGDLLRRGMGFGGVVMSDDVGGAAAVRSYPAGQRAVRFVRAGGDLVLDIVPADVPAMAHALVARARTDPAFAATLRAAAIRVVTARLRAR